MGDAVHRNRVKRILRAAFRAASPAIAETHDIVLIPRAFDTGSNLEIMTASLLHLIGKLNEKSESSNT